MRGVPLLLVGALCAAGCSGSSDRTAGAVCGNVYRSVALETARTREYAADVAAAAPGSDARQRATNLHDASDALVGELIAKNGTCFSDR